MNGPQDTAGPSIGEYLVQRLQDYGLADLFGIPGDYVLNFYSLLERSPINVHGCTREDCAGYAADAYARLRGLGALCVTYCVGGLSVCNSIAGAWAEKSPVVLLTGSPGLSERVNNPLLHHKVRDFRTQIDVFEKLCIACTELTDPITAFHEIDRVLDACVRYKRPVYIDIPRDMVNVRPPPGRAFSRPADAGDPASLREAVAEAAALLRAAERPVLLAGVEVHRFGLQERVIALAEQTGLPVAATLLGKSVVAETHPLYVGIYEGAMGRAEVTRFVEDSDCILILGAFMTDLNLGLEAGKLDPARCIVATSEQMQVRHHHYRDVDPGAFIDGLALAGVQVARRDLPPRTHRAAYRPEPEAALTISRLVARLDSQIEDNTIVVADIGDALFAATDLTTRNRTEFISPAYYTSMGFATPAVFGAQVARPDCRVVALIGDGAFQMTCMELSSVVRRGFAPIVIVLDNGGYGTERYLQEGQWAYNEIHPWHYTRITEVLGGGRGYEVRTEGEFDAALTAGWAADELVLIHAHLPREDASRSLQRLAERLSARVRGDSN